MASSHPQTESRRRACRLAKPYEAVLADFAHSTGADRLQDLVRAEFCPAIQVHDRIPERGQMMRLYSGEAHAGTSRVLNAVR